MSVKIRLTRRGRKKLSIYNIVVADSRAPRDGKFIERLGFYNPNTSPAKIRINTERSLHWLMVGALPTDTTRTLLSKTGVLLKKHLQVGVNKKVISQEQANQKFQEWKDSKKWENCVFIEEEIKEAIEREKTQIREKQMQEEEKMKEDQEKAQKTEEIKVGKEEVKTDAMPTEEPPKEMENAIEKEKIQKTEEIKVGKEEMKTDAMPTEELPKEMENAIEKEKAQKTEEIKVGKEEVKTDAIPTENPSEEMKKNIKDSKENEK